MRRPIALAQVVPQHQLQLPRAQKPAQLLVRQEPRQVHRLQHTHKPLVSQRSQASEGACLPWLQ